MEKYYIELYDGKKRVGKEKLEVEDYDEVLKRVAELMDTPYRIEIFDATAYKNRHREDMVL
ncbi:hypothetical protein NXH64_00850 [Butyrivibrio fibrisolvens]|uniref:hypothetical protein n=1 Tax=Pseudobutyrivibrio ruminis TaxID=46206 RepID=UPI0003F691B1|nr:hypothetical protein [Pseudobutyrivibrio ruminis]MDC7278039.1 hypothetical protein [Butyrivibrio fibrisolvens]